MRAGEDYQELDTRETWTCMVTCPKESTCGDDDDDDDSLPVEAILETGKERSYHKSASFVRKIT